VLRRNVLILHAGALGDFVLAWPLILALGRIHAQSRIVVVTHASKGALAETALHVESADIEQGWHVLFVEDADPPEAVRRLLKGAQSIYSFVSADGDRCSVNLRRYAGDAPIVTLAPRPPENYPGHASAFLVEQLQKLPIVRSGVEQMVRSIAARGISAGRSALGDCIIHPGSGSPAKCWPLERYLKLIHRLKRKKLGVRVLLGEVEIERLADADIARIEAEAPVRRCETYIQLLNELRTAALVVGNDSGPAHLAGIIGVPTVVLFGPTDPAVWKPLGPRVICLRQGQDVSGITLDDAFEAAGKLISG
jgi:ADP-heptose:LPS heptosyltransferase